MAKVIVYTSNVCPYCVKVKDLLAQNNVAFEERNVKTNPDYVREVFEKSGQYGIPVTDIDGTIIIGFNPMKIKTALGIK